MSGLGVYCYPLLLLVSSTEQTFHYFSLNSSIYEVVTIHGGVKNYKILSICEWDDMLMH